MKFSASLTLSFPAELIRKLLLLLKASQISWLLKVQSSVSLLNNAKKKKTVYSSKTDFTS